jgi:hypothetical protein
LWEMSNDTYIMILTIMGNICIFIVTIGTFWYIRYLRDDNKINRDKLTMINKKKNDYLYKN